MGILAEVRAMMAELRVMLPEAKKLLAEYKRVVMDRVIDTKMRLDTRNVTIQDGEIHAELDIETEANITIKNQVVIVLPWKKEPP